MAAQAGELHDLLRDLRGTNGVVASTVISREGQPIASDLPSHVDLDVLALRTAFMQGIGELVMESVEEERTQTVIIVADEHYIMTTAIDDKHILVVVMDRMVEVGGMIPGIMDTASTLHDVLS
ncbi:MAG: roadblock/LC7 domain-containing protein [Thermoplasmata archaeon]|nr:MAG: roadblock/LC7 domain-containing protein [Thermoplasmata archaeon]